MRSWLGGLQTAASSLGCAGCVQCCADPHPTPPSHLAPTQDRWDHFCVHAPVQVLPGGAECCRLGGGNPGPCDHLGSLLGHHNGGGGHRPHVVPMRGRLRTESDGLEAALEFWSLHWLHAHFSGLPRLWLRCFFPSPMCAALPGMLWPLALPQGCRRGVRAPMQISPSPCLQAGFTIWIIFMVAFYAGHTWQGISVAKKAGHVKKLLSPVTAGMVVL